MAGSPKKRARAEAARTQHLVEQVQQLSGVDIVDAEEAEGIPTPAPFRNGAPRGFRPRLVPQPAHPQSGPEQRRFSDNAHANELAQLAEVLRPNVAARIERIKPHWCAGIVEPEVLLDHGTVTELIQFLKEEYGGEVFRVSVLDARGAPAYECRIAIAGLPRREGRVIRRHNDEGETARAQPPAPRDDGFAMFERALALVKELVPGMRQSDATPWKELMDQENRRNERLVNALVKVNDNESGAKSPNLMTQLREVLKTQAALREFAGELAPEREGNGGPVDDMDVMKQFALQHFMQNVFASTGSKKPGTAPPGPPTRAYAPARVTRVHARTHAPAQAPTQAPAQPTQNPPNFQGEIVDL